VILYLLSPIRCDNLIGYFDNDNCYCGISFVHCDMFCELCIVVTMLSMRYHSGLELVYNYFMKDKIC